jgi:hypothetical protein
MGRHVWSSRIRISWVALLFLAALTLNGLADTEIYNDGTWIVDGVQGTDVGATNISVTVAGQLVGSFTELKISRLIGGVFEQVFLIEGRGGLSPDVPPAGAFGGKFHLTGYWDCYAGERLDVRITALNIQPNTSKTTALYFNGALSNGTSLQATDLSMKLFLPNNNTVRTDVSYTLYAASPVCVDQYRQQYGEGFQAARIASNYISDQIKDNDAARIKTVLGQSCDCCGCSRVNGFVCASFFNGIGYIYPFPSVMSDNGLWMLHGIPGPRNTPMLKIEVNQPPRSKCSAQGYIVTTLDPTEDNADLWINWDQADTQYAPGQKLRKFKFRLLGLLPEAKSCDIFLP